MEQNPNKVLDVRCSSAVSVSLEMEPKLEYIVVKLASETAFVRVFPLSVYYLEGDILVRGSGVEPEIGKVLVVPTWRLKR